MAIYPLQRKEGNLLVNWAQYIAEGDASDVHFERDDHHCAILIQVEQKDNTADLPAKILGFSRGTKGKIRRTMPLMHPKYSWLAASSVTGMKGKGYLSGTSLGDVNYARYNLVVGFSSLGFDILPDADVTDESQRWVIREPAKAMSEMLTMPVGTFRITDPAAPNNGEVVSANVGILRTVSLLRLTWKQVPYNFVLDANYIAQNILTCVGKVNSGDIWGFPAGTLLCEAPDIVPTTQSCNPVAMFGTTVNRPQGAINAVMVPPRTVDVTFNLKYWNPDTTSTVAKGWMLYPNGGPKGDMGWYNIETKAGQQQYQIADYSYLFKGLL